MRRHLVRTRERDLQRRSRFVQWVRRDVTGAQRVRGDDQPVGASGDPSFVQRAVAVDRYRESDVG